MFSGRFIQFTGGIYRTSSEFTLRFPSLLAAPTISQHCWLVYSRAMHYNLQDYLMFGAWLSCENRQPVKSRVFMSSENSLFSDSISSSSKKLFRAFIQLKKRGKIFSKHQAKSISSVSLSQIFNTNTTGCTLHIVFTDRI